MRRVGCLLFYDWKLCRVLFSPTKETIGTVHLAVNLGEDSNARFKAVQENSHVVVSYFNLHN